MFVGLSTAVAPAEIELAFREMEAEAHERLLHEGVDQDQIRLDRTIDMRYVGQWRSIGVTVERPLASLDRPVNDFHAAHEREYNFRRDKAAVEVYRLGVTAIGAVPKPELARYSANGTQVAAVRSRAVHFDEQAGAIETPVYDRTALSAGAIVKGPAVIDQLDSTTLIPPGITAEVDPWLNILMRIA
jgi:N-methylhydantoinase A